MLRGRSSEESEDKSDNESDYDPSENEDKGNGDDDGNGSFANTRRSKRIRRRRRDGPVMISIPEATKLRQRNHSGISKREPSILVGPLQKLKRDTLRHPAQRFKDPIVGSSSSVQVNAVIGGTNTTSYELDQDSIFGSSSSSGSIITPPWIVNPHRPNSVPSPMPPISSAQAQANITGPWSFFQPLLAFPATMPNNQQQQHQTSSSVVGLLQHHLVGMTPLATSTQRAYDLRQNRPLLPKPPYNQAQMNTVTGWGWNMFLPPSSNLQVPNLETSFQRNITSPHAVSRPIPPTTLSDVLGSSSSSVQAQSDVIRRWNPARLPAMANYQHQPSSSSGVVIGFDLNYPNNEEDDEGLDLNKPPRDE